MLIMWWRYRTLPVDGNAYAVEITGGQNFGKRQDHIFAATFAWDGYSDARTKLGKSGK